MATENEGQFAHLASLPEILRTMAAEKPKDCPNQTGSRADDHEDEDEDERDRKRDEEEDAKRAKRKRAAAARRRAKAKAEEEEAEHHDEEEEDEHARASEEEDERKEDEKEGKRKAKMQERRRIMAILSCPGASGNIKGAAHMAFNTNLSADTCIGLLGAFAPASDAGSPPARYSGDSLRSRMALVENPAVGANDGVDLSSADPVKMAAAAIINAGKKRRGEI